MLTLQKQQSLQDLRNLHFSISPSMTEVKNGSILVFTNFSSSKDLNRCNYPIQTVGLKTMFVNFWKLRAKKCSTYSRQTKI